MTEEWKEIEILINKSLVDCINLSLWAAANEIYKSMWGIFYRNSSDVVAKRCSD